MQDGCFFYILTGWFQEMASGPLRERTAGQIGGTLDELPLRIRQSNVKPGRFLFRYRLLR